MSNSNFAALEPYSLTLAYAGPGDPEGLTRWDASRWVVPFVHHPTLDDEWEEYLITDGRTVIVRRADCGAGCRCAGEFVMVPHGNEIKEDK